MTEVSLVGYITVSEDRLEDVRAALKVHIRLTQHEPGCLHFSVREHPEIPGRFDVNERFVDQAAFVAHQTRTKASHWATVTQGIPRHYHIDMGET